VRVQAFRGYDKRTREQNLSGKAGFEKRDPAKRLGFFVATRTQSQPLINPSSKTNFSESNLKFPLELGTWIWGRLLYSLIITGRYRLFFDLPLFALRARNIFSSHCQSLLFVLYNSDRLRFRNPQILSGKPERVKPGRKEW